jgi:hypothetical protein
MFFTDAYKALRRGERMLALRYFLISILVIAVVALPAGFFMLRRFEASAMFHPERAAIGGLWRVPQQLKIIEGAGHNDLSIIGGEKYIDSLADFVRGSVRP